MKNYRANGGEDSCRRWVIGGDHSMVVIRWWHSGRGKINFEKDKQRWFILLKAHN